MTRCVQLLTLIATMAALCSVTASARADAFLIPLDGPIKADAEKYGYKVDTIVTDAQVTIYIRLNDDAVKGFLSAQVFLTNSKRSVASTYLGLTPGEGGKGKQLILSFNPVIIDGGEIKIWSKPVKGTGLITNFGGFSASIETLLAQTRKEKAK